MSIDTLATSCTTEDLSRTLVVLETIKKRQLSDWTEIDENIAVIRDAMKRQTESKIYMFHSRDILWEDMWDIFYDPEWYAVYKRIWDRLVDLCWWDGTNISNDRISDFVAHNQITEVFTWSIDGEFLWVQERYDIELMDGWDFVEKKVLHESQIQQLESLWVRVRILNILA